MEKIKVLIVEDEVLVSMDITKRLVRSGFEVIEQLQSGEELIEFLKHQLPDIIILDINLSGELDGIETAQLINKEYSLPLIFLTSITDDKTFTKAQQTIPSAYIQKPFNEQELIRAIELAISNYAHYHHQEGSPQNTEQEEDFYLMANSIFLKNRNRFEKVDLDDVHYLQADGNCTFIHTSAKKYFLSMTLGLILEKLEHPNLLRTHRSFAVNFLKITSFEGNRLFIEDLEFPVSKSQKEEVFRRFKTI